MSDGEPTAATTPWAAAFDPVANMRAVADVQIRSARAAGELIERLIARVDGETSSNGAADGGPRPTYGAGVGVDQVIDMWAQLAKGLLESVTQINQTGDPGPTGFTPPTAVNGPATPALDVAAGTPTGVVSLRATEPVAIWLHNTSQADVEAIRLHGGELRDHEGAAIPAGALRFEPESIASLPARSSREVTVSAAVTNGHAAGVYRGTILVSGLPDAWLPVELVLPDA